jgi:hypothetical protein
MKSYTNWQEQQKLERIFRQSPQKSRSFVSQLNDFWQRAIAFLEVSSEPRVWQTRNTVGETVWSAYAPSTGRSIEQVSASELRIWLEERHYQDHFIADENLKQFKLQQLCNLP